MTTSKSSFIGPASAPTIQRLRQLFKTMYVNAFVLILLAIYLLPLFYLFVDSLKSHDQLVDSKSPAWPAERVMYFYNGKDYSVMQVPMQSGVKNLVLIKTRVTYSEFIDPNNPDSG